MAIVAGTILLVAGIFAYFHYFYKAPVNWTESYMETRQDPYGTSILFDLMEGLSYGKGVKKVDNALRGFLRRQAHGSHANYVFVGEVLNLTQEDADSLVSFARQGNDVFISAHQIPFELNRRLHLNLVMGTVEDSTALDSSTFEFPEEDILPSDPEPEVTQTPLIDSLLSDSAIQVLTDSSAWIDSTSATLPERSDFIYLFKHSIDSIIHFHFTHPELNKDQDYTFQYMSYFQFQKREWSYINDSIEADSGIQRTLLAYLQPNKPVFYQYKVGKGAIYYHTLPLTLTNIYLRQSISLAYVNKLFSHLQPGAVYWDNYHRNYEEQGKVGSKEASPLRYLLSQPSLAWAWYLGLFATGCFLVFFGKRQQRAIPLLPSKVNTSLEFAQTLARFFKKGGAFKIANIKLKNFKMFIWEKYKIPSDIPHQEYMARIAQYSGIDEVKIRTIFLLVDYMNESRAQDHQLMELQKSIEYFYTHCK